MTTGRGEGESSPTAEKISFRRLQEGERSVLSNVSKTRKVTWRYGGEYMRVVRTFSPENM